MADLTATAQNSSRPRAGVDSFPITNAEVLYVGALVQLSSGYAAEWDDAGAGSTFMGVVTAGSTKGSTAAVARLNGFTGDTSLSPLPHCEVDTSGVVLTGLTVLGTPTQAKVGDLIYSADGDPASITLDSSGRTDPIGWMIRYTTATDQDVQLFTPTEHLVQQTA